MSSSSKGARLVGVGLRIFALGLAFQAISACSGKPEVIRTTPGKPLHTEPDAGEVDVYVPPIFTGD